MAYFDDDGGMHKLKFEGTNYEEMGDSLPMYGLPDDGNGMYTISKGYSVWYLMAITKRIHKNDYEHLVTVLPLSLVNGLVYPWMTMGFLSAYFFGRYAFTQGYMEKEGAWNSLRLAGSATLNLAHVATMATSIFLAYRLTRGKLDI